MIRRNILRPRRGVIRYERIAWIWPICVPSFSSRRTAKKNLKIFDGSKTKTPLV
jgi:hypothetical protein